jgi:uncharacterized protein YciI
VSAGTIADRVFFAVRLEHAGPWDFSKGLREQEGWGEHAAFMDGLVEQRFIVLGGPLSDVEILHAVRASDEQEVRARLAEDNWARNGMLRVVSIEPWTILLDGVGALDGDA